MAGSVSSSSSSSSSSNTIDLVLRCCSAIDKSIPSSLRNGRLASTSSGTSSSPTEEDDLQGCSFPALELIRTALQPLLGLQELHAHTSSPVTTTARTSFAGLERKLSSAVRLCDQAFLCYNYADVPICWRRLYTDAILLKASAALLLLHHHGSTHAQWLALIRDLDLAIIVAGCPGPGRAEMVHDLIGACQRASERSRMPSAILPRSETHSQRRQAKRRKLCHNPKTETVTDDAPSHRPSSLADAEIDTFDAPPSLSHFLSKGEERGSCRRPFIVRGFAESWPASEPAAGIVDPESPCKGPRWASSHYLESLAGPGRVVPVEVGARYTDDDWGQEVVLWSDFLRLTGWDDKRDEDDDDRATDVEAGEAERQTLYLAQHDLLSQFPELLRDVLLPDYIYSCPPAPADVPGYRPPGNDEALITMAWMGPAETVSPPHFDMYYNCFVQVVGYKEIWLAPPTANEGGAMSSFGCRPSPSEGDDQGDIAQQDSDTISSSLMTNTSRIDVYGDAEDAPAAFREKVQPNAQKAVLGPGDMLFMPPGWWHSFRSRTKSFSTSMWF